MFISVRRYTIIIMFVRQRCKQLLVLFYIMGSSQTSQTYIGPAGRVFVAAFSDPRDRIQFFNHYVQYRIIKKKKNILHYITRTSRALRGQGSTNACVRVQWRRHVPRPPSISRRHRRRRRRRRHNLILSVTRVASRRYCPSGVRPLNGFINTHIIHDVLFIRMYIGIICTRPSSSCL